MSRFLLVSMLAIACGGSVVTEATQGEAGVEIDAQGIEAAAKTRKGDGVEAKVGDGAIDVDMKVPGAQTTIDVGPDGIKVEARTAGGEAVGVKVDPSGVQAGAMDRGDGAKVTVDGKGATLDVDGKKMGIEAGSTKNP